MINFPEIIGLANADQIRDEGLQVIGVNQGLNEVLVNARALKEFDSSIFSILLAWKRLVPSIVILAAPEKVKVLARVYGLMDLFKFRDA